MLIGTMPRAINKLVVLKKMYCNTFRCEGNIMMSVDRGRETHQMVDRKDKK